MTLERVVAGSPVASALLLVLCLGAAGCYDWGRLSRSYGRDLSASPDLDLGVEDLADVDLAGADLTGVDQAGADLAAEDLSKWGPSCPSFGPTPTLGPGCTRYTFTGGLPNPSELETLACASGCSVTSACGMLRIQISGGGDHDIHGALMEGVRITEVAARTGKYRATARFHGTIDEVEQFAGIMVDDTPSGTSLVECNLAYYKEPVSTGTPGPLRQLYRYKASVINNLQQLYTTASQLPYDLVVTLERTALDATSSTYDCDGVTWSNATAPILQAQYVGFGVGHWMAASGMDVYLEDLVICDVP